MSNLQKPQSDAVDPHILPMQTRAAPLGSIDADKRTVEVTFTSGAAVRRRRWIGWDTSIPFDEILTVSRQAIDLDRLNACGPALDSHSVWSSHSQVGVVERDTARVMCPSACSRRSTRQPVLAFLPMIRMGASCMSVISCSFGPSRAAVPAADGRHSGIGCLEQQSQKSENNYPNVQN